MSAPSPWLSETLFPADARPGRGLDRPRPDRRRTYQWVLPLALLGTLLLVSGPGEGAPALWVQPALLGVVLALSCTRRCPVWLLDAGVLAGGWGGVWAGLLALLLPAPGGLAAGTLAALTAQAPWLLVLLMAHTWLLGERRGRRWSAAGLGGTALLTLALAVGPLRAAGPQGAALLGALVQVLLAGSVALLGQHAALLRARAELRRGPCGEVPDSERDGLTGLPGRRATLRLLREHLRRAPGGTAVALFEVDGLERVRAGRGPAFAECVSAHVARTLGMALGDGAVLGCLRGGVYIALLRAPDSRAARSTCERLRVRVASRPLEGLVPTVSVGLCVWNGHEGAEVLLEGAEAALDRAREDGGHRVHLAPDAAPAPSGYRAPELSLR